MFIWQEILKNGNPKVLPKSNFFQTKKKFKTFSLVSPKICLFSKHKNIPIGCWDCLQTWQPHESCSNTPFSHRTWGHGFTHPFVEDSSVMNSKWQNFFVWLKLDRSATRKINRSTCRTWWGEYAVLVFAVIRAAFWQCWVTANFRVKARLGSTWEGSKK